MMSTFMRLPRASSVNGVSSSKWVESVARAMVSRRAVMGERYGQSTQNERPHPAGRKTCAKSGLRLLMFFAWENDRRFWHP